MHAPDSGKGASQPHTKGPSRHYHLKNNAGSLFRKIRVREIALILMFSGPGVEPPCRTREYVSFAITDQNNFVLIHEEELERRSPP